MGRMLDTGRIWGQSIKFPLVSHKEGWESAQEEETVLINNYPASARRSGK